MSQVFAPLPDGTFAVDLPPSLRELLGASFADLRQLLLTEDEAALKRLYPTAYPDDEDLNRSYDAVAHDQLLKERLEALDTVEATLEADSLTDDELTAWLTSVNQMRLVLGTGLDVTENDERLHDPDHGDYQRLLFYEFLGEIVHFAVEALTTKLPPPDPDAQVAGQ